MPFLSLPNSFPLPMRTHALALQVIVVGVRDVNGDKDWRPIVVDLRVLYPLVRYRCRGQRARSNIR